MRNLLHKIHIYLGLLVGLLISIICFTGSLMVFDDELNQLFIPDRYFLTTSPANAKPLPLNILIPMVNAQLDSNAVSSIKINGGLNRNYIMSLTNGWHMSAAVNPYTGKVIEVYGFRDSFFYPVMSLHRWMLDSSRTWGKQIVGYTTCLFILILLSGIYIWIPKNKAQLKARLSIRLTKGWKQFCYDLHVVLGIYLSVILLLFALTGLIWSFSWYRTAVSSSMGITLPERSKESKPDTIAPLAWQQAFNYISPPYQEVIIRNGTIQILPINATHNRAYNKISFDKKDGSITKNELYKDLPGSETFMSWMYILHVGAWGGIWGKLLAFFVSFLGGSLPLTGYYLYYKRWKKKKS